MGATKNLFELMTQQEIESKNFLFTKKEIILNATNFAKNLIDSGEVDKVELFAQAIRMSEALSVITEQLKQSLPQENFEAFGLKGTYRSGGSTPNYSEDELWSKLKEKLTDREMLLKVAMKSKETIYDSEGCEVPRVSENVRKSSLSITY
jgi:hypothetical protein